ncbi:uncharacterized protein TrAFT101_011247 [Trichoderma asperellum]|uniref:uncharacterized protein n=1 Tax=Trichoderma asperellum TaxID=101201 RepID=UPI0033269D09|nr:hypothetical protein TrAFT101_011247 [Trichoderma asperellum]
MSPVNEGNIVQIVISSSELKHQLRAKDIFNWIKHASEPWTPEALIEALAVHECLEEGEEPSFDDLDPAGFMSEIEEAFCGIIIIKNRDIMFSHSSFYDLAAIGIEGDGEEQARKVNGEIATACLRYFMFDSAQEKLSALSPEHLVGGPWTTMLDAIVIAHQRISLAEYAVRFWPRHYKASGKLKPRNLVDELFSNKKAQAAWEDAFYTLSNPFTRLQEKYISPLPIYVMLDLEDLVAKQLASRNSQPSLTRDSSLHVVIVEAARSGNRNIARLLLEQVILQSDELQKALFWAVAYGKGGIADVLIQQIQDLTTFQWPENLIYRVVAAGLDDVLVAMLQSGCDINKTSTYFWGAPPLSVAIWWDQISIVHSLLTSEPRLDLTIGDQDGDAPHSYAAQIGNPLIMMVLLQRDANTLVIAEDSSGFRALDMGVRSFKYKAMELLIAAEADFESGRQYENLLPPLVFAADKGLVECVRVLLNGGANPNVESTSGTALYNAVSSNHIDVVRLLLENTPKASLEISPPDNDMLMTKAVCTGNTELVSLLIDHGAVVDFVDLHDFSRTPLSRAAGRGDLDMVKLLLEKGADINYTGDNSDSALFTAIYKHKVEVARLLLEQNGDIKWTTSDRWNMLHAAYDVPELVPQLLQKGNFDINKQCTFGSILHLAARANKPKTVAALLEHDPKPDLELVYDDDVSINDIVGYTAFLSACKSFSFECVELLLKAGADFNFRNKEGDDAADILFRIGGGSEEAQKCFKLLFSGPYYKLEIEKVDENGSMLLHKIGKRTSVSMVKTLVESKAPIDREDQDGYTPLAIAINKGNEAVAKYLIEFGASVNIFDPRFGSILHLACANGSLDLVKLVIEAGADLETVDPLYGESLLYTALGIEDSAARIKMVRYLVDQVKAPINSLGGRFGYPIIRAAHMLGSSDSTGTRILKYLIRRKADLNVADDQGRRAVHLASKALYNDGIRALVAAGANTNASDKFGRMPLHFAASVEWSDCLDYLLDKFGNTDVNVMDVDHWIPLLWAARSNSSSISRLLRARADIWVQGSIHNSESRWSALKLANFAGRNESLEKLVPREHTRTKVDNGIEKWDDDFHRSKVGDLKDARCWSCFVGTQWKCIECTIDVSLCFKCYGYRHEIHNREHTFTEIGPLYEYSDRDMDDDSDNDSTQPPEEKLRNGENSVVDKGDAEDNAIATGSGEENSDSAGLEFDPDSYDLDGSD